MPPGITCTAVRREAAGHLAICCAAIATGSAPARALGAFKQAVLVLRRFVDGTRLVQLARDNGISLPTPTSCRYLHEGLTVLPDHTPGLSTALERAAAAGHSHLNLDGTVIRTDRVVAAGPNKADLWWSGKHKHHGGNLQVIAAPDAWPLWCCPALASMFARPRAAGIENYVTDRREACHADT